MSGHLNLINSWNKASFKTILTSILSQLKWLVTLTKIAEFTREQQMLTQTKNAEFDGFFYMQSEKLEKK